MSEITRIEGVVTNVMGQIGGTVFYRKRGNKYYARSRYVDSHVTENQRLWREKYMKVDIFWGELTEEEKNAWKAVTHGKGHTRYSSYMKVNLRRIKQGLPLKRTP